MPEAGTLLLIRGCLAAPFIFAIGPGIKAADH